MGKEIVYRCTNRSGPDGSCEYAEDETLIPDSKVEKDNDGNPICPGETVFGEPCGAILEEVTPPSRPIIPILIGAGAVVIAALGYFIYIIFLNGSAVLDIKTDPITLMPGESAKIEFSNKGDKALKIKEVTFSSNLFSRESDEKIPKVAPEETGSIRVILSPDVNENITGTVTLDTNGADEPVTIEITGVVDPWSVFDRLSRNSRILKPE